MNFKAGLSMLASLVATSSVLYGVLIYGAVPYDSIWHPLR